MLKMNYTNKIYVNFDQRIWLRNQLIFFHHISGQTRLNPHSVLPVAGVRSNYKDTSINGTDTRHAFSNDLRGSKTDMCCWHALPRTWTSPHRHDCRIDVPVAISCCRHPRDSGRRFADVSPGVWRQSSREELTSRGMHDFYTGVSSGWCLNESLDGAAGTFAHAAPRNISGLEVCGVPVTDCAEQTDGRRQRSTRQWHWHWHWQWVAASPTPSDTNEFWKMRHWLRNEIRRTPPVPCPVAPQIRSGQHREKAVQRVIRWRQRRAKSTENDGIKREIPADE